MPVYSEGADDLVVIDDEVAGLGVDMLGFVNAGWADDEGDVGVGLSPGFGLFSVDASEVAVLAGGSEVGWFPPWSALGDGDDVVDVGGVDGAFWCADLAGVTVSFEDSFADCLPSAFVFGACCFSHGCSVRLFPQSSGDVVVFVLFWSARCVPSFSRRSVGYVFPTCSP